MDLRTSVQHGRWALPSAGLSPPEALALLSCFLASGLRAQGLELRFLDVGQGDAVFIRSGGKVALMDAGRSGDVVLSLLRNLGVDTIDLLSSATITPITWWWPCSAHGPSADNGVPVRTGVYRWTTRLVEHFGITYLNATSRTITLGDAKLRILSLPLEGDPTDQNNASVGVVVEFGTFRALLTGDSEVAELSAWLALIDVPDVDVLKAGHHGSDNGLTPGGSKRLHQRSWSSPPAGTALGHRGRGGAVSGGRGRSAARTAAAT
jgi:hypothetical protein